MKKSIISFAAMSIAVAAVLSGCAAGSSTSAAQQPVTPANQVSQPPVAQQDGAAAARPAENSIPGAAAAVDQVQVVRIADILTSPKDYDGKTVVIQGKIASECPSGCWFTLKDGNAAIYIDLKPSNMVIPQKKGSSAKVTAVVVREGSDVYLIGNKVDF